MPDDPARPEAVLDLAVQVDLLMFRILQVLEQRAYIFYNPGMPPWGRQAMERLTAHGLVDPHYEAERLTLWAINDRGRRVVKYFMMPPLVDDDAACINLGKWIAGANW